MKGKFGKVVFGDLVGGGYMFIKLFGVKILGL
jgi:hypothetical protein